MAKIPVEKESGGGGWWKWLLGLLLLALIIWILIGLFDTGEEADVAVGDADTEAVEPIQTPEPVAQDTMVTIGDILGNPGNYVGQPFPRDEVEVDGVPTDRGFWIVDQGDSLFAVIIDQPQEEPKNIQEGQTLQIEQGTLRDPSFIPNLPGVPLDQATEQIAQDQEIFLTVDERYIVMPGGGTGSM